MKKQLLLVVFMLGGIVLLAQPANDARQNATPITHTTAWSSTDAAFTNEGASPDGDATSCTGVVRNVWFKFQATSSEVEIKARSGAGKGTLTLLSMAL